MALRRKMRRELMYFGFFSALFIYVLYARRAVQSGFFMQQATPPTVVSASQPSDAPVLNDTPPRSPTWPLPEPTLARTSQGGRPNQRAVGLCLSHRRSPPPSSTRTLATTTKRPSRTYAKSRPEPQTSRAKQRSATAADSVRAPARVGDRSPHPARPSTGWGARCRTASSRRSSTTGRSCRRPSAAT